jgi:hypothetical protein
MSVPVQPASLAVSANLKSTDAKSITNHVVCLENVNQTGTSQTATCAPVATLILEPTATTHHKTSAVFAQILANTAQSANRKAALDTCVHASQAGPATIVQTLSTRVKTHRVVFMGAVNQSLVFQGRSHASVQTPSRVTGVQSRQSKQMASARQHRAKMVDTVKNNRAVTIATVCLDSPVTTASLISMSARAQTVLMICERYRDSLLLWTAK